MSGPMVSREAMERTHSYSQQDNNVSSVSWCKKEPNKLVVVKGVLNMNTVKMLSLDSDFQEGNGQNLTFSP